MFKGAFSHGILLIFSGIQQIAGLIKRKATKLITTYTSTYFTLLNTALPNKNLFPYQGIYSNIPTPLENTVKITSLAPPLTIRAGLLQ
jgi:hypothetical protein